MSYIYLASPYSDPDGAVREFRYIEVARACATLLKQGRVVYSPIVHCHDIANAYHLPGTFDFWQNLCLTMLEPAKELWVLALPGYSQSHGVNEEIAYAKQLKKAIRYVYPEELEVEINEDNQHG